MSNPYTASEVMCFMGNEERGVGWCAERGWVDPSNDHVDLYTEAEALITGVPENKQPPQGSKWRWIKYDG